MLTLAWVLLLNVSHGTPDEIERKHAITVLTYNTHRMGLFRKSTQNQVIHHLRRTNADIVCLQEVEVYKDSKYLTLPELRDAMRQYPYTYYDFKVYNRRRQFGNVVFSKYPLFDKQTVRYSSRSNISSRCDFSVETDTFRLFVNHLESNRFTREDFNLPDSLTSDNLRESARHISHKLESARQIRRGQAEALHKEIASSPYPVIVVGDFNATPLSYTYLRILASHTQGENCFSILRDTFLETSWGRLGWTFVKHHIGLRIDYILCSRHLHPTEVRVDEVNYSDHYPVLTTLTW